MAALEFVLFCHQGTKGLFKDFSRFSTQFSPPATHRTTQLVLYNGFRISFFDEELAASFPPLDDAFKLAESPCSISIWGSRDESTRIWRVAAGILNRKCLKKWLYLTKKSIKYGHITEEKKNCERKTSCQVKMGAKVIALQWPLYPQQLHFTFHKTGLLVLAASF